MDVILDSIADGVFTIDNEKNVTSFNKAAAKITGVSREQAIGQKCFDVFRANICETSCVLEKTLKTGKEFIDLPVNILNSKGKTIPISISTAVLKDKNGKVIAGARVVYTPHGSAEDGSWFYSADGDSEIPNGFDGTLNEGASGNRELTFIEILLQIFMQRSITYGLA
jgi:PAS domain S-box-containing protein